MDPSARRPRFSCRRLASPAVLLLAILTLTTSEVEAQEMDWITDDLNTAAAVLGVAVVTADVGFTVADTILAVRNEHLPARWAVVEIVCAAPIAVAATIYSFQARDEELWLTIPIAVWSAALTTHGIVSLSREQDRQSLHVIPTLASSGPGLSVFGRF